MTPAPTPINTLASPQSRFLPAVTQDDQPDRADELDQYYTQQDVACALYLEFCKYFNPQHFLMVEPSAGTGSFFSLLPPGSLGYDIEPKYPGIEPGNFLEVDLPLDREIAIIGNPPFGKKAAMAVAFFNRAAMQSSVVALIVPKTFRKASIQNKLHSSFHPVAEVPVPRDAFVFRNKPYDVPTVFQIWERRSEVRELHKVICEHPDFDFVEHTEADFAIQRVGARAGRVHHRLTASPSSHHFIRGPVETIMRQLDFARVASNVAGNPSLAKSEIVHLYCEWLDRNCRAPQSSTSHNWSRELV